MWGESVVLGQLVNEIRLRMLGAFVDASSREEKSSKQILHLSSLDSSYNSHGRKLGLGV